MGFWGRILSLFLSKDIDDNLLLLQMNEALQEESELWHSIDTFVDPYVVSKYQKKWSSTYNSAKRRAGGLLFSIGLSGRSIRKDILQFIETYESIPSTQRVFNERVTAKKIVDAAGLVQPVEGTMLDEQQLRCIVKEVHSHLVLAGAGTGKTTTIVGYVKYLLKRNLCTPDDILVLSFTNASAMEMSRRLEKAIGRPIAAKTFHKLGMDIITSVQGIKPKIHSEDVRIFVRKQLETLIQDAAYLRKLCLYLAYSGGIKKSEFEFHTMEEYQSYLKNNPPVTIKNENVKSYGELDIANYLTQNRVVYEYEKEYPIDTRTSEYGQYHPDFYLPKYDLYIEYFGINRQGMVPSFFTGKNGKSASQTYQEGIKWKRELHKKNGTRMIEVYAYEKFEEVLLSNLEEHLKAAGVVLMPMSAQEMWAETAGTENQKLDRVAELFGTVITLVKSDNYSMDDVRRRNGACQNRLSIDTVIDLVEPIYNNYQSILLGRNEIDFNDMINLASSYVQNGRYVHPYSHVIVDEYQDISQARYRLLDSMRMQKDYRLFCVGDDWQSIYRFSGSDIGFILNFERYWGASEISRIETTYRFPQSLISVSSGFIMRNPEQKQKQLRSAVVDPGFSVGKITGYTDAYAIKFLGDKLAELPGGSSVLFLGRYRFDIRMLDGHSQFAYLYNAIAGRTEVTFASRPDLKISYMTVHGSKGLQADYVFLLNNKNNGMSFPSKIEDPPILQLLLDNCDHYHFAEERRLFYVAITRAKKKVWLVTLKGNESEFVQEIDKTFGREIRQERYSCPLCGGRLVRRSGPHGEFYGCSNYKTRGCQYMKTPRALPNNRVHGM